MTIIIVIILITSCKHFVCSDSTNFSFQIAASIIPDKDSIHVGDTIWLQSNNSSNLKDTYSGNMIDYSGVQNLGTLITLLQFQSGTNIKGAISKFDLNITKGTKVSGLTDPMSNQGFLYIEENKKLILQLAIVPADTGRFVLTISNSPNVYRKNDVFTKAAFEIDFQNTNQHFYLLDLWRPDLTLDALGKPKVYYFKVY